MITKLINIKSWIIYLFWLFFGLTFLFGWKIYAIDDLLYQIMEPSINSNNTIDLGNNVQTVWNKVIKWSVEWDNSWLGVTAPITVKITRLLLILTIALSITMILYNWMIYIIQTWQWKEWKSLMKNVLLIVVWILVALFSVVIINLIQSIPTTLDKELIETTDPKLDDDKKDKIKTEKTLLKWKKMEWDDIWDSLKNERCKIWHEDKHCEEYNNT